jgi:hypothetical protein
VGAQACSQVAQTDGSTGVPVHYQLLPACVAVFIHRRLWNMPDHAVVLPTEMHWSVKAPLRHADTPHLSTCCPLLTLHLQCDRAAAGGGGGGLRL